MGDSNVMSQISQDTHCHTDFIAPGVTILSQVLSQLHLLSHHHDNTHFINNGDLRGKKASGVSPSQDSPALASHETILMMDLVLWRFQVFSFCTSERRPVRYSVDSKNAGFCQDFLKQLAGVAHGTKGSHSENAKPFRFGDQFLIPGSDTGAGRDNFQSLQPVFIVTPSSRTYGWGGKEQY